MAVRKPTRQARKPLQRFPRRVVRVLEQWLIDHRDAPYATQQEQDELKVKTGLKRSQIMNWFANARKRRKIIALQDCPSPSQSLSVPGPMSLFSQLANLHPFERWLHQGPAQEAASLDAIREAIDQWRQETRTYNVPALYMNGLEGRQGNSTNWQYFRQGGSSISSLEIRSYAANIRSVCSEQWRHHPDVAPTPLTKSVRRHRRPESRVGSGYGRRTRDELPRKFQCTFCSDCFKKKYDWQRHEKSQHLPLERWTCCPQGSVNVQPETNEITCVFCGASDPTPEHIHGHGYTQCMSRCPAERNFYRKDHLRQHLRLMHYDCIMIPAMETWKSAVATLRSRCGFCGVELKTWNARVEHLSEHFQNGTRMEEWNGDWGFDPEVSSILERATLPETRRRAQQKAYPRTNQSFDDLGTMGASNRCISIDVDRSGAMNVLEGENYSAIRLHGADADYSLATQQPGIALQQEQWDNFEHNGSPCNSLWGPLEYTGSLDQTLCESSLLYSDDGLMHDASTEWIHENESSGVLAMPASFDFRWVPEELYSSYNATGLFDVECSNKSSNMTGPLQIDVEKLMSQCMGVG